MANERQMNFEQGDFCHVELPVKDPARAKAFYSEIFGWKYQEVPEMEYTLFATPGGRLGGGLFKPTAEQPAKVTNYLTVTSIDETAPRIKKHGGKLLTEKTEIPGHGSMLLFEDPEGNLMALFQAK